MALVDIEDKETAALCIVDIGWGENVIFVKAETPLKETLHKSIHKSQGPSPRLSRNILNFKFKANTVRQRLIFALEIHCCRKEGRAAERQSGRVF